MNDDQGRQFFKRLWEHDLIVFELDGARARAALGGIVIVVLISRFTGSGRGAPGMSAPNIPLSLARTPACSQLVDTTKGEFFPNKGEQNEADGAKR